MLKKSIGIVLLAMLSSQAQAAVSPPQTWNFSFTGFKNTATDEFMPDAKVFGTFVGIDHNQDGHVTDNELSSLEIDGFRMMGCGMGNDYDHCSTSFSYTPGQVVQMDAYHDSNYPMDYETVHMVTGQSFTHYVYNGWTGQGYNNNWHWTDQTRYEMLSPDVITSVPEPETWGMMLAGLGALAFAARRRKAA